jgi:hypothetical protein
MFHGMIPCPEKGREGEGGLIVGENTKKFRFLCPENSQGRSFNCVFRNRMANIEPFTFKLVKIRQVSLFYGRRWQADLQSPCFSVIFAGM